MPFAGKHSTKIFNGGILVQSYTDFVAHCHTQWLLLSEVLSAAGVKKTCLRGYFSASFSHISSVIFLDFGFFQVIVFLAF